MTLSGDSFEVGLWIAAHEINAFGGAVFRNDPHLIVTVREERVVGCLIARLTTVESAERPIVATATGKSVENANGVAVAEDGFVLDAG